MPANVNDYPIPASGKMLDSNSNIKNLADGIDTDGGRFAKDRAIAPVLIDTIPFSSFTVNNSLFKTYSAKLNRNAKKRVFIVKDGMDQPLSSLIFYLMDSTVYIGGALSGDNFSASNKPLANNTGFYSSNTNPLLGAPADSLGVSIGMGATAPTTGNVYIYVTEVI